MTFQEFLAAKRALAIVEHMDTLSEDDARELFEQLDDDTIELIEMYIEKGKAREERLERAAKRMPSGAKRTGITSAIERIRLARKARGVNPQAEIERANEALEIIDLASTLSESQAIELFEGLDDGMIELIEQLLGEVTAGTLKKVERRSGTFSPEASAARTSYYNRDRTSTPPNWMFRNQDGGFKELPPTPSKIGQNRIARQRDERTSGSESGQSETREPASELKMRRLRSTTPERVRLNLRAFRQGTQASKYPTQQEALEIIDLASTLSEADALELFEQLDDATVELIEQLLDEGSRGQKPAGRKIAAIRNKMYPYAVWHGEGDGAEEMEKTKQLRAQQDNIITGLRGSGRNVRGVLRAAETIRNRGRRTSYDEPGLKGAELQQHVDAMRKARGEEKQTGAHIDQDPRSPELRSLVRRNEPFADKQQQKGKRTSQYRSNT